MNNRPIEGTMKIRKQIKSWFTATLVSHESYSYTREIMHGKTLTSICFLIRYFYQIIMWKRLFIVTCKLFIIKIN